MCCRSFCGLPQGQSLPNRIRSAPKARTRDTKASSESICRSSGSASSRGVSEPREKAVSSRADVSASSSGTCSQQRQPPMCASTSFTGPTCRSALRAFSGVQQAQPGKPMS